MATITFSIWRLMKENKKPGLRWEYPNKEDFPKELDRDLDSPKGMEHVLVRREENGVFFAIESGSAEPRDDFVIDINSKEKRENPRKETEIELLKQLFVYFDFKTNLLYLSDIRYRKHFEQIIHEITGNDYILKGIYKEKDTFLDIIKTVEEIKFVTQNDLFSADSKKKTALEDLTGVTDDIDLTLDIKTNSHRFRPLKLLKELMEEEDRYALSGLLIRGKDEKGFECIYNQEKFIRKINISAEKISGKFDVFGVDWSTPIELAKEKLSPRYVLQGNMEPTRLYSKKAIDEGVDKILSTMKGAPHIFNLGHGILPDVPVENAKYFIKEVQRKSAR